MAAATIGASMSALALNAASVSTAKINTQASGSTFLVFIETSAFSSISDNKGNQYELLINQTSGLNTGTVIYWCENGVGGVGHQVTVDFIAATTDAVYFVELANRSYLDVDVSGLERVSAKFSITTPGFVMGSELVMLFGACDATGNSSEVLTPPTGFTTLYQNLDGLTSDPSILCYGYNATQSGVTLTWDNTQTPIGTGATAVVSFYDMFPIGGDYGVDTTPQGKGIRRLIGAGHRGRW